MPTADFRGGHAAAQHPIATGRRWILTAAALPLAAAVALLMRPPASDLPASVDLTALAASAQPLEPDTGPRSVEVTVQRNDTLDRIFRAAGIDNTTLTDLRQLPDVRRAIDADLAQAKKLNVTGTPSFFINGRNLSGAQPFPNFKRMIDLALEAKG